MQRLNKANVPTMRKIFRVNKVFNGTLVNDAKDDRFRRRGRRSLVCASEEAESFAPIAKRQKRMMESQTRWVACSIRLAVPRS